MRMMSGTGLQGSRGSSRVYILYLRLGSRPSQSYLCISRLRYGEEGRGSLLARSIDMSFDSPEVDRETRRRERRKTNKDQASFPVGLCVRMISWFYLLAYTSPA